MLRECECLCVDAYNVSIRLASTLMENEIEAVTAAAAAASMQNKR